MAAGSEEISATESDGTVAAVAAAVVSAVDAAVAAAAVVAAVDIPAC